MSDKVVLILTAEGPHRESLAKVLKFEGYTPQFVSILAEVKEYIAKHRPATFMHDWNATDPTQAAKFQQSLAKIDDYADICRVIYVPAITPELMAFAADCGVRRVISYSTTVLNLITEIKMAQTVTKNLSDLQHMIHKAHTANGYKQEDVDHVVEDAYTKFPHDNIVRIEYGNLRFRKGDARQSLQLANQVLGEQPTNVRAMNLVARIMMKEGKLDEATKVLENANGLSPFNTDRLVMLGDAFFKQGNNEKAKTYFGVALSQEPENTDAQKGLGQVMIADGDANAAIDLLRNSASEEEACGFFNNAAVVAAQKGALEDSLKLYQSALQVLKTNNLKPQVYFNVALALDRLGHYEEAEICVRRCLKYEPKHQKGLRELSRLHAIKRRAASLNEQAGREKKKRQAAKDAGNTGEIPPAEDFETIGGTPKKTG